MDWSRSDTLALAAPHCAYCHGLGLRDGRDNRQEPCNCVLREIFRACYSRFRSCVAQDKHVSQSRLEIVPGVLSHYNWGRKNEEYIADFSLVTRRALNDAEYRIFKYHFLLGADWRMCCGKLNIDRGIFFHMIYRMEEKLGRLFRELRPYGLYPLAAYFEDSNRGPACSSKKIFKVCPIRPPLSAPKRVSASKRAVPVLQKTG